MNCILAIPGIISKYFMGLSEGLSKKMRGILLYYVTSLYLEHMCAYTLILKHLMCGSFDKLTSSPPETFEQALHLIQDLITVASLPTLNSDVTILIRNKDVKLKIPA